MSELKYYFSIFLRRLHYFLIISVIIAAVSAIAAFTLPPAYESQTRLLLEGPQIPSELASSTVTVGLAEQLEIIEQRLMTRANMLDVARSQAVFKDIRKMTADEIVDAMRARTVIRKAGGRNPTPIMTISFEARSPRIAAGVLNEYLTLIERQNAEFRTTRAGNTLEFFQQEVERLGRDLDEQSARILEFKTENSGALPESLQYRLDQQATLQEQVRQIDRDIATLRNQRSRLIDIFEATGQLTEEQNGPQLSPEEQRLQDLQLQLDEALSIYSETNPRVKMLKARIAQAEERLANAPAKETPEAAEETPQRRPGATTLDLQLSEIDTRVSMLQEQRGNTEERLKALSESLAKTPGNTVALDELTRAYANIEQQYNTAVDRLAQASTGERIESLSRGQRISIIEPPATPDQPTKPNRILIAGGGMVLGIAAGIAFVVLLELLNHTARRPEDIIKRIGVRPLATIPYMRSRSEILWKRLARVTIYLAILVGLPAAVYAVHLHYLPLDLLADRVMNKIGVRW
ncbi:lipopolysaccharide biosynthesis [Roseovarius spongiae]|uniref:Lipopolysaccharide biosynthesis n=1 Tax=Roseovarius spongiae TaxID=2320272 RepID=A0A3A8ASS6_9RHOB|nr:lipopolysaccharide biosynthesis [Roseovarius spongiae]RKF12388.1 lipopolysaccharide biosynthesis [Roseovarius spongiae]